MKIGDKKFSEASRTLDNTAKAHLGFLMATGLEYGLLGLSGKPFLRLSKLTGNPPIFSAR
jgi:hypothetical protein